MKVIRSVLLFSIFILFPIFSAFSQTTNTIGESEKDSIILMNGTILKGRITEIEEGQIYYEYKKKRELRKESLAKYRIFSIKEEGEPENIIYEQDSAIGNTLDVGQMRMFLRGEGDAIRGYKEPWSMVGGMVVGAAGGYLLNLSVFTLTVPLVYTLSASIPKIRIDKSTVTNEDWLESDHYLKGYEKEARSTRLFNSLKGSAIGILVGVVTYIIINPGSLK